MCKENCRGVKCHICLNDSACCSGEYQPLIDDSLCNTCVNASNCYETYMAVDACSEYLPDVPQAASAPRHIDMCKLFNYFSPLSLRFKRRCK